jgi:hypothetical protein
MYDTYDTLDAVPWHAGSVTGPCGNTVGIDANGFAVWLSGPRATQRIPLDAHGPWTLVRPSEDEFHAQLRTEGIEITTTESS